MIIILDIISNKMVRNKTLKPEIVVRIILFPVQHFDVHHVSIFKYDWKI